MYIYQNYEFRRLSESRRKEGQVLPTIPSAGSLASWKPAEMYSATFSAGNYDLSIESTDKDFVDRQDRYLKQLSISRDSLASRNPAEMYSATFSAGNYDLSIESTDKEFVESQERYLQNLASAKQEQNGHAGEAAQARKADKRVNGNSSAVKEVIKPKEKKALSTEIMESWLNGHHAPSHQVPESQAEPEVLAESAKESLSVEAEPVSAPRRRKRKRITAKIGEKNTASAEPEFEDFQKLLKVVQVVKKSPQYKTIEEKVLSDPNQLNRILLSSYFGEGIYRQSGLTTGEIESITKALGIPLSQANIAAQMKRYSALFSHDGVGVPERGIVVHYKLNNKGRKKFENLLD